MQTASLSSHMNARNESKRQYQIRAEGLRKSFKKREVVRGVDLELQAGEIVGLLGPNGAGKTTIFDMVVGLCQPDQGRIVLNGKVITHLPMYQRARRGIGYLPQEPSVFPPFIPLNRISWRYWKLLISRLNNAEAAWRNYFVN